MPRVRSAIVQHLALLARTRVATLTLVATWGRTDAFLATILASWRLMVERLSPDQFLAALAPWAFTYRFLEAPAPEVVALQAAARERGLLKSVAAYQRQVDACLAHDTLALLPLLRTPSLVLVGEDDILTPPRYARALGAALPRGEVVLVPASGHACFLETPKPLAERVLRFLAATRSRHEPARRAGRDRDRRRARHRPRHRRALRGGGRRGAARRHRRRGGCGSRGRDPRGRRAGGVRRDRRDPRGGCRGHDRGGRRAVREARHPGQQRRGGALRALRAPRAGGMGPAPGGQPARGLPGLPPRAGGAPPERRRGDRQPGLAVRAPGPRDERGILRRQGGRHPPDALARARARARGHPRQLPLSGRHRYGDAARVRRERARAAGGAGRRRLPVADGAPGAPRRDRRRGALPGLGRRVVRDRCGPPRRWRRERVSR